MGLLPMTTKLNFTLENLPHPFTSNPSQFEAWGRLTATIFSDNIAEKLFLFEYNLETLASWFSKTSHRWDQQLLTTASEQSQSQVFDKLEKKVEYLLDANKEQEATEIIEQLGNFSEIHDLGIALSGLKLPKIHISAIGEVGEISISSIDPLRDSEKLLLKPPPWRYKFNIEDFQNHLRNELNSFLAVAIQQASLPQAKERFEVLQKRLWDVD